MLYDTFSTDYDRFVNWPGRLAVEMPFLDNQLKGADTRQVLDSACGTGMHAIALAKLGYEVIGTDFSAGMVERARLNAAEAGVQVRFEQAGFGEAKQKLGKAFDAVLCLGNSLPHALTGKALSEALADFAACLKPGGLLLIQNRNFDAVLAKHERWMEPQSAREGEAEWLFMRFYDYEADGLLTFNVVTLRREGQGGWTQSVRTTQLRPLLSEEMSTMLAKSGFEAIARFGDMTGAAYSEETSGNLVVTARRASR